MRASSTLSHACTVAVSCCLLLLSAAVRAQPASSEIDDDKQSPASAGVADDPATVSARAHFRLGVDFYRERNFRAALIEFQRAYADSPHFKLLYNLGQASVELQEYASAIDFLAAYLREGGAQIAAERRAEVEQSIRHLESRIGRVEVLTNQAGAEVYVDDTLVGRSPLSAAVRVGAGRHQFTVSKEGFASIERQVDVAAGDTRELRLDFMTPMTARREPSAPPPPLLIEAPERSSSTEVATIAGVSTAALAAGAITLTILTGVAQENYQEELLRPTSKAKLDGLRDDSETRALVTDILWGATLVGAVVTTLAILTGDDGSEAAEHSAAATVGVSLRATGAELHGRF